jgi:hypothetical protein
MASVKYLRDGEYRVERIADEGQRDSVSLTVLRVRPVMPPEVNGKAGAAGKKQK